MPKQIKSPQTVENVKGWPDLVTLWALEVDARKRERILTRHGLLMKVIERKALDAFSKAITRTPRNMDFHLASGLGYDLERLASEIEVVFGTRLDSFSRHGGIVMFHDAALEALGNARQAVRDESPAIVRRKTCRVLVQATERLYDAISQLFDDATRRAFIEDGMTRTTDWLSRHDDPSGEIASQRKRLRRARRRLNDALENGLPTLYP